MSETMNHTPVQASTYGDITPTEQSPSASTTRVYRGRTVEEIIPRIQDELGNDAIVVRQNKGLTGGVGGFFQRPFVEIEARHGEPGVDRYDETDASPAMPPVLEQSATRRATSPAPHREGGAAPPDAEAEPAGASTRVAMTDAPEQRGATSSQPGHELFEELAFMRDPVPVPSNGALPSAPLNTDDQFAAALADAEATARQDGPSGQPDDAPAVDAGEPIRRRPLPAACSPSGRTRADIESSLIGVGLGEDLVHELIETAAAHVLPLMPKRSGLAHAVRTALRQCIPACPPPPAAGAMIAVVGPGGSGRTSCCEAILETYRTRSTLPAACATFVSADAIGPHSITLGHDLPRATPLSHPQVARALSRARSEGLLLLDLPPVSPAEPVAIDALASLLDSLQPDRVIAALPATLGAKAAAQLLQAMRPLEARAVAITHADETDQLGVAVQAACTFDLAPEYLLDRRHGAEALTLIDPTYLADRLIP